MSEHGRSDDATTQPLLSEQERAAMFTASAPLDRNVKRSGGHSTIPPKAVAWALVAFVILGLGGAAGEHYFGNLGTSSAPPPKFLPSNANLTPLSALNSLSVDQYMNLKEIANAAAPPFTLRTPTGHKWSLQRHDGKVIVLAFYNAPCNDICPVLGQEIRRADTLLGQDAANVEFVIVNTDPRDVTVNARPLALSVPSLQTMHNVIFLTGTLHALDSVWTAYGLVIKVGAKPSEVSHNNIMYFIGAKLKLEAQVTPLVRELSTGVFTLKSSDVSRFSKGIATIADSLVK